MFIEHTLNKCLLLVFKNDFVMLYSHKYRIRESFIWKKHTFLVPGDHGVVHGDQENDFYVVTYKMFEPYQWNF